MTALAPAEGISAREIFAARRSSADQPRSARSLLVIALIIALAFAGLTGLGVWQLQRRVAKLDLIERVAQRIAAAPVAAPGRAAWPGITDAGDGYRRLRATGRYLGGEVLVKAVTEVGGGFWLLAPFRTDDGFTVLVNRGFVPPQWREASAISAPDAGEVTVTGLLRITEPNGAFLHANDPAAERWYSRDVAAIGAARGFGDLAPYFIDADATADAGGFPRGGLTVIAFHNSHLVYALTWFSLALMVLGGGLAVARDEWRIRKNSPF